jgi:FkbM family methyltransferase
MESARELLQSEVRTDGPFRQWYRAWTYRLRREPAEIRFVLRNLRRGDVALDIGAHKGAYTYWMYQRVAPTGRVYAFEPQAELAQRLQSVYSTPRRRACVSIEPLALSCSRGERTLHIPGGEASPSASLAALDSRPVQTRTVLTETLDAYAESHHLGSVRLIKCDVEGHELEVFEGGRGLLSRLRPILLFECERRWRPDGRLEPVFDYLCSLGYRGWFFDPRGALQAIDDFGAERYQRVGTRPYLNNFVFTS